MIAIHVVFFANFYTWIFNGIFIGPKFLTFHMGWSSIILYSVIFGSILFHICLCSYRNFIFSHFSLSTLDLSMAMLWVKYVFNKK